MATQGNQNETGKQASGAAASASGKGVQEGGPHAPPSGDDKKHDPRQETQGSDTVSNGDADAPIGIEFTAEDRCRNEAHNMFYAASGIANNILANPNVERFLGGNPLDHGKYNGVSRPVELARRAFKFAVEFETELGRLRDEEIERRLDALAAEQEAEPAKGNKGKGSK